MSIVSYKDYQGSVSFEDGRLLLQILHLDDIIITECDKASEVQPAFENLVDDYIATCASLGKEPNRPFKGTFNVRVAPTLHRRAAMSAAAKHVSLNAWVQNAMEENIHREAESERPC